MGQGVNGKKLKKRDQGVMREGDKESKRDEK